MGCDIHTAVEIRQGDGSWKMAVPEPGVFDWRDYGLFGFLADLRNYSSVPNPWPPRGWPGDVSKEVLDVDEDFRTGDGHTFHWLTLDELQSFDYDAQFEDRRYTKQVGPNAWDGGATAEPGNGKMVTYREFLPEFFFKDLVRLAALGKPQDVRVLMYFDN